MNYAFRLQRKRGSPAELSEEGKCDVDAVMTIATAEDDDGEDGEDGEEGFDISNVPDL